MAPRPEAAPIPAARERANRRRRAAARVAIGLAAALFATAATAAGSGIYKWTDAEGHVHYGDRPGSAEASEVEVQRAAPASATEQERREKRDRLLRAFEADRAEQRAKAAAREKETEKRDKLTRKCARARDSLRVMRDANRLYDFDASGKRVYLSDDERAKRVANLERQIADHCK